MVVSSSLVLLNSITKFRLTKTRFRNYLVASVLRRIFAAILRSVETSSSFCVPVGAEPEPTGRSWHDG